MKNSINSKRSKGITLIALVITIIVLLILAGVTVNTLTGDNGLLTKTSEAQFKTEIATYKEELDLSIINDEAETKGNRTNKFNETEYDKIKKLIPSFAKKYENVLVVEDDKLVYKGNDKTLYKKALDMGMLSENELLDDEILEELQPFITEWTVEAGDSITLPIGETCYFTVNYGDGTGDFKVTSSTDENRIHTYTNAGTYTVTIKGKCKKFSFDSVNTSKDKITRIKQWGCTGFTNVNFRDCLNLGGTIPNPSNSSFENIIDFSQTFYGCRSLQGSIPDKLFKNCINVKSFQSFFSGCSGLTGNIPEKLFENCTKVTNLGYVFRWCSGLTGNIPENLFENCTEVDSVAYVFKDCSNLKGRIPDKLFHNCSKISNFTSAFENCSKIEGNIPQDLFENCEKVTSFEGTFYGCENLTGQIPCNLFGKCSKVSNFSETFYGCKKLYGNIPENLFKNNIEVKSFRSVFSGCSGLTGDIPDNLFINCSEVTNFRICI